MYRFVDCFDPECPQCKGKPVSEEPKPYFHNLENYLEKMRHAA